MPIYVTDGDGSLQAAEVPLPLWAADIRAGPLDIGRKKVVWQGQQYQLTTILCTRIIVSLRINTEWLMQCYLSKAEF